jgi:hypothetical protein
MVSQEPIGDCRPAFTSCDPKLVTLRFRRATKRRFHNAHLLIYQVVQAFASSFENFFGFTRCRLFPSGCLQSCWGVATAVPTALPLGHSPQANYLLSATNTGYQTDGSPASEVNQVSVEVLWKWAPKRTYSRKRMAADKHG